MRYKVITLVSLALLLIGCGTRATSPLVPTPLVVANATVTYSRKPTDVPTPNNIPLLMTSPSPTTHALIPSPTNISSTLQVRSIILSGHLGWISSLAWSPDGKILASASGDYIAHDKTARLWRSDGTPLAILSAHTAEVYALAWSPDGKVLATGAGDGTIRLWQPNGTLIRTLISEGTVFGLAWSPDSKILASGSSVGPGKNVVQFWTVDGALLRTRYTDQTGGKFYNVSWSPNGQFIVAGAIDYKLWRSDGTEIFHYDGGTPAWALVWSPDSQRWVVGNESGNADMYDTVGNKLAQLDDPVGSITSLAWSPNGQFLVGGDGVSVWQADGRRLTSLSKGPSAVSSVVWSPDGKMFAVGSARNYGRSSAITDHTVRIWNANLQLLTTLVNHTDDINVVAWSPDGKILASGSKDRTIRLWLLNDSGK